MKKYGFGHRALAMLLVLIMTVQLLPLGVFAAFGDLQGADTGVDVSTLKLEDAINWPIKVYDYLSDGMLFEPNDTNTTTISDGHSTKTTLVPYGGGYRPPVTELGSDFTYSASSCYTTSSKSADDDGYSYVNSPYGYRSGTKYHYTLTKKDAVDYQSPYYLRISDNTSYAGSSTTVNHNMLLNYFAADQSTSGNIRYMVMVYRANKVEDYYFSISLSNNFAGGTWDRNQVTLPDSTEWTYKIFDLSTFGSFSNIQHIWLTFGTNANSYSSYKGMNSGAYLDLTHVGYFSDLAAANNYGAEAVKFDKDPGEYLRHQVDTTYTYRYVTTVNRGDYLNNIFSLNYRWHTEGENPQMFGSDSTSEKYADSARYGMDFTTHSLANGYKTNAYTSDTYRAWDNGTTVNLKYTDDTTGDTDTASFVMDRIGVEEKTQSNGAQFVRLTTTGPSKIILSKLHEDAKSAPIGQVAQIVLVYRANGLDANTPFGLFAQGPYRNSDGEDVSWKYPGLTKTKNWLEASNVNPQYFNNTDGWTYQILNISDVIKAKDSEITEINRLERVGLYLPTLADGKSLDLAYVGYFKNSDVTGGMAEEFAENAVAYLNSSAKTTLNVNQTQTYTNSRVWYGGGNKSFGMLYSSGGGQYWPSGTSGGESTSTNQDNYGYEFDTWMIGYKTNSYSGNAYNTARYNLVWNESTGQYDKVKYTANYTGTSSTTLIPNASGTTNNVYFFSGSSSNPIDTTNVVFDGYQILENIAGGVMTAGLLQGSLQTVTVEGVNYRVPVYRQETVEYIAYNLLYGLRVPQKDSSGNYNTKFIKGTESTQYGGVDLNGDGVIGWINYDGDSRSGHYNANGTWVAETELNEASVDLATALRHELGLHSRLGNSVNVLTTSAGVDATHGTFLQKMGNYDETLAKSQMLYGEFSNARNAIDTAMDAAYYLLNNIFISNSYNQAQDDYDYLTLSSATVKSTNKHNGKFAYVFDAGFTTGQSASAGTAMTDDGTNASAIVYSPYNTDGTGKGTISMENVTGKTRFDYYPSDTAWTTRFPFQPITDAEGDYAGRTQSYYFMDDAQRIYTEGSNTYKDRNYNYVIASNGEFVYHEEDGLFFQFEGDDDVYLFINGELVLDIGGAHSITSVDIDINEYVEAAAEALAELEEYGYYKDMSIDEFDAWISASTLVSLDEEGNETGTTETNPYSDDEIAAFKRWHRLNLSDGQICQFDFYYMERHGWGANMRILTNMRITDPNIDTEKLCYQYGDEIEYGGVIDPTSSVEYNFKLINTGNTKLYNLTWTDAVLGVTMDPTKGLTVSEELNGIYVLNASGGALQPKDMSAVVEGYDDAGNHIKVDVTFPEEDGDGGQTALKNFLATLAAEGTEAGLDDAEVTKAGSGLWVDASVTFKGIYYMLTPEQTDAAMVDNTVYLEATTKRYTTIAGCRTLRDEASHRLYTNGFPIHYQWAGHQIFMNLEHLLEQAILEANRDGSQLSLYQQFFKNTGGNVDKIYTQLCDKYGRVGGTYPYQRAGTDANGKTGYFINYDEPGVYVFYLLMYMRTGKDANGNSKTFKDSGVNASEIGEGYYAILRSQVFVSDVEDSVYVLDYGLSTESLDANGELFKNDYLFGSYGTIRSKLMGVTGSQPSYLDPETNKVTGIDFDFSAEKFAEDNRVFTPDGIFKVNLAIPKEGKNIAYDSNTGEYTLTGAGTVTLNAVVPTDGNWDAPCLYYWYSDGTTGPAWPGTPMTKVGAGNFKVDIPADVNNVIINNGSAALQTQNLEITAGLESTITVSVNNNVVSAVIDTVIENFMLHAKLTEQAAEKWGDKTYLHYWRDDGTGTAWPGVELTEKDENGYYTYELPGDTSYVILNDGGTKSIVEEVEVTSYKQSGDLDIYAGKEVWIEVSDTLLDTVTGSDGATTEYYGTTVKYTLTDTYTVHTTIPESWGDEAYLYYWHSGTGLADMEWPGYKMTKGDFGWYTLEGVPADVVNMIVTDGSGNQTVDLTVTPGLETWIMVRNAANAAGKYTAEIAYGTESGAAGLTFTPTDFIDSRYNNLWLALTVHATNATPSVLNSGINIHNEVQMYKKITILPATVVYYEDDFAGIKYNKTGENTFTYYGDGSGLLSQSIDQNQVYGQDSTYQDSANNVYSGDHLTSVKVNSGENLATFTFKGTGFELIGRTNAVNSGTIVAKVYKKAAYEDYVAGTAAKPEPVKHLTTITQFDQDHNGGAEAIDQVPTIRLTGLDNGWYTVELSGIAKKVYCGTPISCTVTQAPTCTVGGYATYSCESCGKIWGVDDPATGADERITIPATGHSFNSEGVCSCGVTKTVACGCGAEKTVVESKDATCVDLGWTTYKCNDCAHQWTVYKAPTGHGKTSALCGACGVTVVPAYHYEPIGVEESYIEIDGLRIYQPLGTKEDAYIASENKAQFLELRDLIVSGQVAVAKMKDGYLNVSSGTSTWSENLSGGDFDDGDLKFYVGNKVESADSYLTQGPNNEVYMEGTTANAALAFYVKETEGDTHTLQIAVRALDYAEFYGAGTSALNVQIQYGIKNGSNYEWKNLTRVVSGTEQYYTIPYTECPKDSNGNYQIVIRAVNGETDIPAMVSYSNVKLLNMEIQKVEGVGESTILYYLNGLLVEPTYYLTGNINGVEYGASTDVEDENCTIPTFKNNELTMTFNQATTVGIRRDMLTAEGMQTLLYTGSSELGNVTSATLFSDGGSYLLSVPAGDVTFKIVQTENGSLKLSYCAHTWDTGVITREPNCTVPGIRTLSCTKCGHTKNVETATDPDEHTYSGGKCVRCGAQEPKFYLVGYINGANYGCEGDYANMGDYLFVDGKLVVTFQQDSFVFVKADGNAEWYMINAAYDDTVTSAVLRPTSEGFTPAEKMFVPGGDEITFTLVHNDDGTLTLSYERPCAHQWGEGEVTTDPTCTEDGVRTYTCGLCGKTRTEVIEKLGHNYENGYCTNCGEDDPDYYITLYFKNTAGWDEVCIYTWDSQETKYTGEWPGTAMTLVEGETDLYSYTVTKHATLVIFNNNNKGSQTGNLTIPTDGRNQYTLSDDIWSVRGEDTVLEYNLIGYINGADSGTGNDSENCDSYRFTDTITVNFTSDSYVAVKRADNSKWYFAQAYSTETSTVFFADKDYGEKMLVPAGTWDFTLVNNGDGSVTLSYAATACEHSYSSSVTDPTCTAGGYTTHKCSLCGHSYTDSATEALGHSYENGTCTVCGASEAVTYIYFKPNSNWTQSGAWFAAYFFGNGDTWVAMESCGDNCYRCAIPSGYPNVIFCRMNPASTTLDWGTKWNQTAGLIIDLVNSGNCYTYTDNSNWDKGSGEWSTYTEAAAASEEIAVYQTVTNAVALASIEVEDTTETGASETLALNLNRLQVQMNSTTVYGVDDGEMDDSIGGEEPEVTDAPVILPIGASLAFKDEIYYNVYFRVSNPDDVEIEEMGLVTWTSDVDGTVSNGQYVLTGAVLEGENYKARSQAISAKNMGEELYFKVYLKLADGSYVYTDLLNYSAKTYATNKLKDENAPASLKALCVALMNYGAAAQEFFGYKTDDLMNADLTDAQKALVDDYSADMIADMVDATAAKIGGLTATGGYSSMYPSVNFGGAFGINYIFTPTYEVEGEMKLYVWTAADYANADVLTLENASQVLTMTGNSSGVYTTRLTGIAAKNVGDTVYVCGVYESDGVEYRTGVLAYSVGEYCKTMAQRTDSVEALAKATGVYTYYARLHLLGA